MLKRSDVYLMTLCCVYLMATMGLNLTVGYAGQMSLGQAAFFGIGAYIAAILMKFGWPFFVVLPIAAIACFAIGLALGFPALRVQHHYLAFATLGFNVLVFLVMRNEEKITGGTFGISNIPRPSVLGMSTDGHIAFFYFTLASLLVLGALLWYLLRSPWGRAFAALRDNPIRAESLGVNITAYTLLAFAIGAACAGIGGVYYASLVEFIEPGPFHFSTSLMMLLAVIVGGSGRFFGPVVGTIIIILLPEALRASNVEWLKFMQKWYLVFFGVAVVAAHGVAARRHPVDRRSMEESAGSTDGGTKHDALPRGQGRQEAVRCHQGRRRRHVQRRPGRDRRRDRAQRLGQDDALQQHPRADQAHVRPRRVLRRGHHRHVAARVVAARRRPHVPDAAGVRQDVGARQPHRGCAGVQGHARRRGCSPRPTRDSASMPTR